MSSGVLSEEAAMQHHKQLLGKWIRILSKKLKIIKGKFILVVHATKIYNFWEQACSIYQQNRKLHAL